MKKHEGNTYDGTLQRYVIKSQAWDIAGSNTLQSTQASFTALKVKSSSLSLSNRKPELAIGHGSSLRGRYKGSVYRGQDTIGCRSGMLETLPMQRQKKIVNSIQRCYIGVDHETSHLTLYSFVYFVFILSATSMDLK